ncbi:ParB/RepB/Spo0J family partition protein, partial [Agathobacter rectalis]|uniref:ParB/RepB/Spo0J family partition protein n=1 Tax=Agathobacter rectalis TaxID=39491 RepID=UPI0027D2CCFC
KKIPVIIRMMQDDEAVVTMVDSNLQREQITPSEKAYAYKMKYDAIKKKAGRKKIPVIIRMMQDDEAVVTMVDSNLQREQITPSEKAYAYKRKYDAIKKKAGRKNCGQVDHNTGKRSIDVIGELCGDSAKQVQRYIKMTELIPALLDKVDDGSMGFTPAVQLSYLKKKEQQEIIDAMEATQCTPSLSQAIRIKKLSEAGKLTESEAEGILGEIKQKEADRVVFKNEQLYRFFPSTYTSEQMRREILEILKSWRNSNWI